MLSNSSIIEQFTLLALICTFPSAETVMLPQNLIILLAACLPLVIVNHVHSLPVSKDGSGPVQGVSSTLCEYPCQHSQPSPSQGYPNYGAPPPPPPPIPPVAGPSARVPPPPWPVQGNCPPGHVPACCSFPPPITYGGGGYAPPDAFSPPSPYGYVPIEGYSCVTTSPRVGLLSIVLLLDFLFVNNNYV